MTQEEIFEVFDEHDCLIGTARRGECHGNPGLIHRTAHVVVYHPDGRILLQRRSMNKDIQPGKWDTAVGGHVMPGETYEQAAVREMTEELGLPETTPLKFLFDSRIRNDIESENVRVFSAVSAGPFDFQKEEIDEVAFWDIQALKLPENRGNFTPNLVQELDRLLN
ncbi:MAG: NUDIX domain-containing protein [Victivallaceae bacterium]|jgi:isopentenyldiphosphate isomerase